MPLEAPVITTPPPATADPFPSMAIESFSPENSTLTALRISEKKQGVTAPDRLTPGRARESECEATRRQMRSSASALSSARPASWLLADDLADAFLRAVEQRGMRLDFRERSRHVHFICRRLSAVASLFPHQFLHPGERVGALFGEQPFERVDPPSAGVHCGFHLSLLPLDSLRRSGFGSGFHMLGPFAKIDPVFNISIDRASRHCRKNNRT